MSATTSPTAFRVDAESVARLRARTHLGWIDSFKGIALLWIVCNHLSERIFGSPYIANPEESWPPLAERVVQLAPIGHGPAAIAANIFRYIGWAGDQGVGLFIVASGFVLALGAIEKPMSLRDFYSRRLLRIYPLWIAAHLAFILSWFILGKGLDPTDPRTIASILGLRFIPSVFYYFAPAWWYIGLALQLYLIFPLLVILMRRIGAAPFAIWCIAIGCVSRGIGLYLAGSYVDPWSRGAFFITRLPEFALGMSLAALYCADPDRFARIMRAPVTIAVAIAGWFIGNALSLTLLGMSVAPLILSATASVVVYALISVVVERVSTLRTASEWTGRHSYSLYLTHQPFIAFFVVGAVGTTAVRHLGGIPAALAVSVILALSLEWITGAVEPRIGAAATRVGAMRLAGGVAGAIVLCYGLLLAAEIVVRDRAPLEVLGWGERPSLEPDAAVGWKLKPNQTHRLRWTSYDYTVVANALGFSGPLYPEHRSTSTFRVFTLGDAFTSAEGVDTGSSWPRRLETILQSQSGATRVQVMNFAITGYGPNQYAAVVRTYAPRYRPNLIVVGMFVNDFEDALRSNDDFQKNIGFSNPSGDSLTSLLELSQLKMYWSLRLRDPMLAALLHRPSAEGAFLGNIRFFDRKLEPRWIAGARVTQDRYLEIQRIARRFDGRVAIVLFPAPVQICGRSTLAYYPHHFDLNDSSRYDNDFPQRTTALISERIGVPFDDLRAPLQSASSCPYQSRNMHLTIYGQDLAARAVAAFLAREALVPRANKKLARRLAQRRQ